MSRRGEIVVLAPDGAVEVHGADGGHFMALDSSQEVPVAADSHSYPLYGAMFISKARRTGFPEAYMEDVPRGLPPLLPTPGSRSSNTLTMAT